VLHPQAVFETEDVDAEEGLVESAGVPAVDTMTRSPSAMIAPGS
jgi:hypothetical protein